ncbi:hypothetical protein ABWI13_28835 [Streptomyces koyangensis]|uniref:hypothetical protein n=1 Tax=Streptomyces koyangensis TaxID=188770 RepID=UPI0033953B30
MPVLHGFVSLGGPAFPARFDPRRRWKGSENPYFTLCTVRDVAAFLAESARHEGRYGLDDTVHVVDDAPDGLGGRGPMVVHIRWPYLGEPGSVSIIPNVDGWYGVGGFEWCWYAVSPQSAARAGAGADPLSGARHRLIAAAVRDTFEVLRAVLPEAAALVVDVDDGAPIRNVVCRDGTCALECYDTETLGEADQILASGLDWLLGGDDPSALGWTQLSTRRLIIPLPSV